MKAMILAAGRGERMRPLTDSCPKPLLKVNGQTLIEYHIQALVKAGINELVINHAYLGKQIEMHLGNGQQYGATIQYSPEPEALETGGGIFNALAYFDNQPFIIVNGDVWTHYDFSLLPKQINHLAHLVMINNPAHNLNGDFFFDNKMLNTSHGNKLTYSGIAVLHSTLFQGCRSGAFPLAPLLRTAIANRQISAEHYSGIWTDVGTPERLAELNREDR